MEKGGLKTMRREKAARRVQMRRASLWLSVLIALSGMVFGVAKLASRAPAGDGFAAAVGTVADADRILGERGAKVTLVEYSDFQCPACKAYHPLVKELAGEFGKTIVFAYRHFPLPQHARAHFAARASEAAGRQNKFWEMHDLLFERQNEWAEAKNANGLFAAYAEGLGLNANQFKNDFESDDIKEKVNNDLGGGMRAGVNATPTFFLNGKKIDNPRNYDQFRNLIKEALAGDS